MSKNLLSLTLLVGLLLCSMTSWAQRAISGRVTSSEDGSGLPGVYVIVKGQPGGGTSDVDGNYKLSVPEDPTTVITFSSIGFKDQSVTLGANTSFNIVLELDVKQLSETVVIGYGTVSKKDLTGSVVAVSRKDFQQGMISTPEQLIAGKVAGVQITPASGAPGSSATIRIRGGSSINASNDPLYVIDGVPIDNNNVSGVANPLSLINPNDIETFTILKDASATAIYGSRASNGVIMITTRKGALGKPTFTFSTNNSISTIVRQQNVLSADDFRKYVTDSGNGQQKSLLGKYSTDWQKQIYQPALSSDNSLSVSGGLFKVPYRLSFGYTSQKGILKTDRMERQTIALQVNPSFLQGQLKLNLNLKGSSTKSRFADQGAIGAASFFDPTQPIYADSTNSANPQRFGGYYEYVLPSGLPNTLSQRNPLALINQRDNTGYSRRSIGNAQIDYSWKGFPALRANVNAGYDYNEGHGVNMLTDSAASGYIAKGKGGSYNQYKVDNMMKILETYLAYTKEYKSIHSFVDLVVGHSYQDWNFHTVNYRELNYSGDTIKLKPKPSFPDNTDITRLESYYGRLNYTFMDKYLLTATIRSDKSSRFSAGNRIGIFPSMALSWKVIEEKFMKKQKIVSDLKFRVGYGLTGQQDGIERYPYQTRYTKSNLSAQYQLGPQFYQMWRPKAVDPNLKWESTETYNAAMDFGFLKSRITGSLDVYYRQTFNLLNIAYVSSGTFSDLVLKNIGTLENKGVELSLNGRAVDTKDFTWDIGGNITFNRNKITRLTGKSDSTAEGVAAGGIGIGQTIFLQQINNPYNSFYVYQQKYGADGKPLEGQFVNQNGDKNADGTDLINEKDKIFFHSTQPKFYYGITTNVTYKKFTLTAVMRGSQGGYTYNQVQASNGNFRSMTAQSTFLSNASTNILETHFSGPPRLSANQAIQQVTSSYFVQDASFFRCDNISLGYNIGEIVKGRLTGRVNFTIQNAFLFTPYKGIDPEQGGIDNNFYPRPRTYVVGLAFDFK